MKYLESIILAVLLLALNFTTIKPHKNHSMVDDGQIEFSNETSTARAARYINGKATFTKVSKASFELPDAAGSDRIVLRMWDYKFGPVTLLARDGVRTVSVDTPGKLGKLIDVVIEGPFVDAVNVDLNFSGRPAFGLDSVIYEKPGHSLSLWSWVFVLTFVPLVIILVLSRFISFPVPTTGVVYPSIDIARALAVIFVILLHARGYSGLATAPKTNMFELFASNGQFGVEIFYVLSAFTLSFSLMKQSSLNAPRPLQNFWIRRMARILPALLVLFFGITVAKVWIVGEEHDFVNLLFRLLTMTYIFDETVRLSLGHTVWWSIATEFQFYLIMPLLFAAPLAWAAGDMKKALVVSISVPLLGFVIASLATTLLDGKPWLARSLLYHAIPFSAGIALACITTVIPDKEKTPVFARGVILGLALIGVLLVITFFDDIHSISAKLAIVAVVVSSCIAIFCGRMFDTRSTALTKFPILRSIGVLSFLIYLLHVPVMQALRWFGGSSLFGSKEGVYALMVVGSVFISWIIGLIVHKAVEAPVMRYTSAIAKNPIGIISTYIYVIILLVAGMIALAMF